MLDWLIIGGGIHGVHLAVRLIGEGGVAPDRLRIIDPADRLLERWRACTATVGMTHLRSPAVHHLDIPSNALQRFAGGGKKRKVGRFASPYNRPSLELFNSHCDYVVERFELSRLHIKTRALVCSLDSDGVVVKGACQSDLRARHAVLAVGATEQPLWPPWAPRDDARVHHVFAIGFDAWPTDHEETVVVVGGGISAGQAALRLSREGHRVHLVARHALREHQFDSDPGWLGPKHMARFGREASLDRRRRMIREARHRGSVPPDVRRKLRRAVDRGRIVWHEAAIHDATASPDRLRLRLSTSAVIDCDRVLLATGFSSTRPGGRMVDELVESASLPCAGCGYPVVDHALRWHPRLHVSGPLAELELGPTARNIAGARRAADRLIDALRNEDLASTRKVS